MHGFYNRILYVDLTDKKFWEEDIDDNLLKSFLGGRGLGASWRKGTWSLSSVEKP